MNNPNNVIYKNMFCKIVQYCLLFITLSYLMACSAISYNEGVSPDDLPKRVTSIYLKNIIPLSEDFSNPSHTLYVDEPGPLTDDLFIAKIVQSDITIDLMHAGYRITNDPNEGHELCMTIFLFYQPDNWPIANRYIHLKAEISKPDGLDILYVETTRKNWFGSLGDYIGFSGEEMMADTTYKVVALSLDHFSIQQNNSQIR